MHLKFRAQKVSYNEAIGGEIVQVVFEEFEEGKIDSPFERSALYLLVSMNYEFDGNSPTLEWYDGNEFNGGAEVLNYKINRNSLQMRLNNNLSFNITFSTDENTFINIVSFMSRMFGEFTNA